MSNPCNFKRCCTGCKFVPNLADRPKLCVDLKCDEYKPCSGCKENRPLDQTNRCVNCGGEGVSQRSSDPMPAAKKLQAAAPSPPSHQHDVRSDEITFPGEPPERYSGKERQYYNKKWEEYAGYYRDPTAFTLLHNIILIEVELMHTISMLSQTRSSSNKDLEGRHERLAKNMKMFRDMLPKREAMELNEDEKSLGMIHERYLKEKGHLYVGGISRALTSDAICLAPHLNFPINTMEILQRLGYRVVDIATAMESYIQPEDVPKDIDDMLEFMGFFLKAKYALPDGDSVDDEYQTEYGDDGIIDAEEMAEQVNKILSDEEKNLKSNQMRTPLPEEKKPFAISYDNQPGEPQ